MYFVFEARVPNSVEGFGHVHQYNVCSVLMLSCKMWLVLCSLVVSNCFFYGVDVVVFKVVVFWVIASQYFSLGCPIFAAALRRGSVSGCACGQ